MPPCVRAPEHVKLRVAAATPCPTFARARKASPWPFASLGFSLTSFIHDWRRPRRLETGKSSPGTRNTSIRASVDVTPPLAHSQK
jgi:hypothetical protein